MHIINAPAARREKNGDRYAYIAGMLADASLKPGRVEIAASTAHFCELLAIRRSSPLFRLRSAEVGRCRLTLSNPR